MFEEALEVARANPEGDPWAESRALITLAGVSSETADEEDSFALASQGLVIAETRGDRFSVATARDQVAAALRRLGRLEEAIVDADAAVDAFRELGARWELASALTSRGIIHRLARRPDDAVRDLREAFRICLDLREKAMISWTASSLAKALAEVGDASAARQVLSDAAPLAGPLGEWSVAAEAEILLAEGDREAALDRALASIAGEREGGSDKDAAARTVWAARVFGQDAVGDGVVAEAQALLERVHLGQAALEAELAASLG
jgi:tetratricopeptide (TPR) repeat protein